MGWQGRTTRPYRTSYWQGAAHFLVGLERTDSASGARRCEAKKPLAQEYTNCVAVESPRNMALRGCHKQSGARTYGAGVGVTGAAAVAGFFEVRSKFLVVVEVMAREFEVVKARRGCATALRALLAWWLPDRSILCEEWRGRHGQKKWEKRDEEKMQPGAAKIVDSLPPVKSRLAEVVAGK